jgi:hypothetical protein
MRGNCLWDMFADTQSGKMRYGLIRCTGTRKCKVLKTATRRIESEVPKKEDCHVNANRPPSAREAVHWRAGEARGQAIRPDRRPAWITEPLARMRARNRTNSSTSRALSRDRWRDLVPRPRICELAAPRARRNGRGGACHREGRVQHVHRIRKGQFNLVKLSLELTVAPAVWNAVLSVDKISLVLRNTSTRPPVCTRASWTGKAFGMRTIHAWSLEKKGECVWVRTAESLDGWLVRLLKPMFQ